MSQNESPREPVNLFSKLLKTKIFISQKFLDTPLFRLIRFRQKVLTDFCPVGTILPTKKRPPIARAAFSFGSSRRSSVFSRQCENEARSSLDFPDDRRLMTDDCFSLFTLIALAFRIEASRRSSVGRAADS